MKPTIQFIVLMSLLFVGVQPGYSQLIAKVSKEHMLRNSQPSFKSLKAVLQDFKERYKVDILHFDLIRQGRAGTVLIPWNIILQKVKTLKTVHMNSSLFHKQKLISVRGVWFRTKAIEQESHWLVSGYYRAMIGRPQGYFFTVFLWFFYGLMGLYLK